MPRYPYQSSINAKAAEAQAKVVAARRRRDNAELVFVTPEQYEAFRCDPDFVTVSGAS